MQPEDRVYFNEQMQRLVKDKKELAKEKSKIDKELRDKKNQLNKLKPELRNLKENYEKTELEVKRLNHHKEIFVNQLDKLEEDLKQQESQKEKTEVKAEKKVEVEPEVNVKKSKEEEVASSPIADIPDAVVQNILVFLQGINPNQLLQLTAVNKSFYSNINLFLNDIFNENKEIEKEKRRNKLINDNTLIVEPLSEQRSKFVSLANKKYLYSQEKIKELLKKQKEIMEKIAEEKTKVSIETTKNFHALWPIMNKKILELQEQITIALLDASGIFAKTKGLNSADMYRLEKLLKAIKETPACDLDHRFSYYRVRSHITHDRGNNLHCNLVGLAAAGAAIVITLALIITGMELEKRGNRAYGGPYFLSIFTGIASLVIPIVMGMINYKEGIFSRLNRAYNGYSLSYLLPEHRQTYDAIQKSLLTLFQGKNPKKIGELQNLLQEIWDEFGEGTKIHDELLALQQEIKDFVETCSIYFNVIDHTIKNNPEGWAESRNLMSIENWTDNQNKVQALTNNVAKTMIKFSKWKTQPMVPLDIEEPLHRAGKGYQPVLMDV